MKVSRDTSASETLQKINNRVTCSISGTVHNETYSCHGMVCDKLLQDICVSVYS